MVSQSVRSRVHSLVRFFSISLSLSIRAKKVIEKAKKWNRKRSFLLSFRFVTLGRTVRDWRHFLWAAVKRSRLAANRAFIRLYLVLRFERWGKLKLFFGAFSHRGKFFAGFESSLSGLGLAASALLFYRFQKVKAAADVEAEARFRTIFEDAAAVVVVIVHLSKGCQNLAPRSEKKTLCIAVWRKWRRPSRNIFPR